MKMTVIIAMCSMALAGCATKQFAQVGSMTDVERTTMSCHDIDMEIARTQGVQQTIVEQDKFDGRDVLAFLGDWGIGNHMAKTSAEESVSKRMTELSAMRSQRNCAVPTQQTSLN